MTYRRETLLMKRISFLVRGSRDLRETRDWSETSSSRVAPVAHPVRIALTCYERRPLSQAGR